MSTQPIGSQPRLHNEVYDFIHPDKFKNKLNGQTVLITGAGGTIGGAIAECFSRAGATVCLVDLHEDALQECQKTCLKLGAQNVVTASCDVSNFAQCEETARLIKDKFGEIDILINNAGTATFSAFHTQDPQNFVKNMAVNLNGPFFLMRLFLPDFIARKRGCIINTASRGGTIDTPFNISYNTSKAALIRLTACLQTEVDAKGLRDIHMYALHPGGVLTNMSKGASIDPALAEYFPPLASNMPKWIANFKTSPYLMAMTSVALATGIAKDVLRGRYYDCEHDLGDVLKQAEILHQNPALYSLSMQFLGGLQNDGGMENREPEKPFRFD